jgi:hypothetical protein
MKIWVVHEFLSFPDYLNNLLASSSLFLNKIRDVIQIKKSSSKERSSKEKISA